MICLAGPRRVRRCITIGQINGLVADAPNPQPAVSAWIQVPHSRIAVSARVCLGGPFPNGASGSLTTYDPTVTGRGRANWQIQPYAPTAQIPGELAPTVPQRLCGVTGGIFVDSDGVAVARSLPDVWEYQGPTGLFRVDCNLNLLTGVSNYTNTVLLDVTFECADAISEKHFDELIAGCKVWLEGSAPVGFPAYGVA